MLSGYVGQCTASLHSPSAVLQLARWSLYTSSGAPVFATFAQGMLLGHLALLASEVMLVVP